MKLEHTDITMRITNTILIENVIGCASATASDGLPMTHCPNLYNNHTNVAVDSTKASTINQVIQPYSWPNSNPAANHGYLLKNPLNGGTPAIANAATPNPAPTTGIVRIIPRNNGIERVPVA